MDHGPAVQSGPDKASGYKSKLGIKMFIFYGLVYLGFILINTISPKTMTIEVLFGLNLAVVYGFGLIILAIIQGMIYNSLCTKKEDELNNEEEEV